MPTPPARPLSRLHGLDGLRAVAVTLVVVYHLFPGAGLDGGFAGVDVFFVISGFLITTLLLREHAATGRIGLVPFWRRRARRLLPALALLLTVCASAAWIVGGDVLVRLGAQLLGAVTFTYNWVSIAAGNGYFGASAPELFRNLWSLAVEEQFYVLWPLLLPLLLIFRRTPVRVAIAVAAAGGSALWMWRLASAGDVTRAYFGTDSHAFGLLLGVGLAFWMQRTLTLPPSFHSVGGRLFGVMAGPVALAGIVALALVPASPEWSFPGALLLTSLLTAGLIAIGTHPGSWFGRAIDVQPLRWIGDRSYGIYLWHWPILVLLTAAAQGTGPEAGVPLWIGLLALGLTLVIAEASYRLIELPVRRHGFRGSLRMVRERLAGTPRSRFAAISAIVVAVLAIGGTSAAVAAAPQQTSAEAAVAAGAAAVVDQPTTAPTTAPTPTPSAEPEEDPSSPAPASPVPSPSPTPIAGQEITAIGDSVMLASAPALFDELPGIAVDAAVSRSMWSAPGILQNLADRGELRKYVVVSLGTNGPVDRGSLDQVASIVGPDRELVLVNAFAPRDWIPGVNADLQAFAAEHPGVIIADWSAAIGDKVGLLAGDQIHPGGDGGRVYADVVSAAVDAVEAQAAQQRYVKAWRQYRAENPLTRAFE